MMVNFVMIFCIFLDKWVNLFVDYMIDSFLGVFIGINQIMISLISSFEWVLIVFFLLVMVVVFVLLVLWLIEWKIVVFMCFGLFFIISLNLWEVLMLILFFVLVFIIILFLFGVFLGILLYCFNKVGVVIKFIFDIM